MIRIGVTGVAGRMGSLIALLAVEARDMELSGALEAAGNRCIGADAGQLVGAGQLDIPVKDDMKAAFEHAGVIIDFTVPSVALSVARYASETGKALVIGTTGFTDDEVSQIRSIARSIPIVMAPNMSIGVNVMFRAVAILTELLGEAYDIEIVEAHHRLKKDAPSGTALGLARAVAQARDADLNDLARYERHGIIGARPEGQIGIQTVRAGDIVGDHTVLFAGNNERIEITHRAHTRRNFAQGAVRAARWVAGREPGLYSMMDVLGLKP